MLSPLLADAEDWEQVVADLNSVSAVIKVTTSLQPPLQALNLTASDRRLMGLGSISRSATGQVVGAEAMAVKVITLDPDTVRAVVREATFPEGAEALVGSSLPPLSRLV